MVTSVTKTLINKAPFYTAKQPMTYPILAQNTTCHEKSRSISLPSALPHVNEWLRRNSMQCIVWAAQEIERLLHFLNEEDRWYEKFEEHDAPQQDLANGGGKRFLEMIEGLVLQTF